MSLFGWHDNDCRVDDLRVDGNLTFGDAATDNMIIKGRVSSMTVAGASMELGATYTYGEAIELRYAVTDWTGIGSSFKALYLRSEADLGGSYGLRCAEFYSVMDTSTTTGLSSLQNLYAEMLIKSSASNRTLTNGHCIEANISVENQTGTLTLTNNIYCLYAKAQTGTGINNYTKVCGIKIAGRDDGTARVFGNALDISDPEATVCTWTKGINISTDCTTGISIAGASTTGISIVGNATDAIKISGTTVTDGIDISSACSATAINIGTQTLTAIDIADATTGINFSNVMDNAAVGINFVNGFAGKAIKIGTLSSTESTYGAKLDDTVWRSVEVNSTDANAARLGATRGSAVYARLMIFAGTTQEDWAVDGLTKISSVLKTANVTAGVMGRFESTATCTLTAGNNAYFAGVVGRIGTGEAIALGDGSRAACILAFGNNLNSLAFSGSGKYVGVCVTQSTVLTTALEDFDYGIEVMDDVAVTGISIGSCTTGISISGAMTTGINVAANLVIPQLVTVGTSADPMHWDGVASNILIYTENIDTTPASVTANKLFLSAAQSAATTSGRLECFRAVTASYSTLAVTADMRCVVGQLEFSGAMTYTGASAADFSGAYAVIASVWSDSNLQATGNIYPLGIFLGVETGSAFNGESSYIYIYNYGKLAPNSVMKIYTPCQPSVPTYLFDRQATFGSYSDPFCTGDVKNSSAAAILADGHIKILIGSTPYYIPIYDTLV